MARASRTAPSPPEAQSDDPADTTHAASCKVPATRRGRDTRARLLVAGREVFSRTGFYEVRITDITRMAGVANGTFYTYFDSKEEIFREVAAQVLYEMSEAARGGPEDGDDPAGQFVASTRRYFACIHANARIARSIEEMQTRESDVGGARRDTLVKGVKRIERWIRRLQREGVCRAEVDPWPVALSLHAMLVSVAYDHLVHRDAPEETETLIHAMAQVWGSTLGFWP